jgi:hypothetical protein
VSSGRFSRPGWRKGLIGDIRFDRYGDLVEGLVAIFRVTRRGPVVDRVVIAGPLP